MGRGGEFKAVCTTNIWGMNALNPDFIATRLQAQATNEEVPPFYIGLEPISISSQIDDRVSVSKYIWAATLVTHGGIYGNHAEILLEGINDGFYNEEPLITKSSSTVEGGSYFMHLVHSLPEIKSKIVDPSSIKYESRSKVWLVSSQKVKQMIREIEREMAVTPLGERGFSLLGEDSLFSGGRHNCFTWAREKPISTRTMLDELIRKTGLHKLFVQ